MGGTALHSDKDLAVSLPALLQGLICRKIYRCPSLSLGASLLAPLGLLRTGVTRYPSPRTYFAIVVFVPIYYQHNLLELNLRNFVNITKRNNAGYNSKVGAGECSDFPPLFSQGQSPNTGTYYYSTFLTKMEGLCI